MSVACAAGEEPADVGVVEPLMPRVETSPAAHIAPIVSTRIRRGLSQPRWWVCSHVRKPVAAEAAIIAQPTHTLWNIALGQAEGAAHLLM